MTKLERATVPFAAVDPDTIPGGGPATLQEFAAPAIPQTRAPTAMPHRDRTRAAILNGAILPTLMKLALPTMAVLVAQTAVKIAEAYYVGFLGTDALAGVAMVFPVFMLMTMMSNGGVGSGVASSVARAVGAGRKDDADALLLPCHDPAVIVGAAVYARHDPGGRCCTVRSAAAAKRSAPPEILQLSVRRRDPGVDRQSAGGGLARLGQCQGPPR